MDRASVLVSRLEIAYRPIIDIRSHKLIVAAPTRNLKEQFILDNRETAVQNGESHR